MINLANAANLNGLIQKVQKGTIPGASNPATSLFGHFSTATLVIGLLAGLVGSVYFLYGKRQSNFSMLFTGLALWVVPFFITSALWLTVACGALAVVPFVVGQYF